MSRDRSTKSGGAAGRAGPSAGEAYRRLAPAVLGYFRARRVPEPEDLLGDVFLQVAKDVHRFEGDDDALRRWVFAIAHNRMIDDARRRARRPVRSDREMPDLPAAESADLPDPELLDALAGLTEEQLEVVTLRFVADLPVEVVARITGRTSGAVKSLQHRALENLRKAVSLRE